MSKKTLAKARLAAAKLWPAANHAIFSLYPVETERVSTMAVDKHWRIYYNPHWTDSLTTDEAAAVICHEVAHLVFKHAYRAETMGIGHESANIWNVACDLAINPCLLEEGMQIPKEGVLPENFNLERYRTAEWYLKELRKLEQDGKAKFDIPRVVLCIGRDGSGQGPGGQPVNGPGSPSKDGSDSESEDQQPGEGGSCADGIDRPWEVGEISEDAPGMDEADAEAVIMKTAERSQNRGNAGAGMRRHIDQILHPKVNIKQHVMRAVRNACDYTAGVGERSYRRPSRRPLPPNVSLPSTVMPVPRITFIIDTSGSMGGDTDLALCVGMVGRVLQSFQIRDGIKVVTGDTQSKSKEIVYSDPMKIALRGGGGTDMGRIIEEVAADKPKPGLIICCTDGYTPWPRGNVGVPVLVCLTRPENTGYPIPTWMKKVCIGQ